MRALDLFSGAAAGWTLGLHRAGIETVAACEADPWRRAVYERNWPGVKVYDDVRTLTGERVLADVGAVDLVAGSPPCQDASTANAKGRGIDGERTGLFLDALRLVRELRPRWVCLENVPGIRTRGADRIIAALEEAGYACWPLVVGAVHAGAPHLRKRVWFLAYAGAAGHGRRSAAEWSERQPWAKPTGGAAADASRQHGRARSNFAFAAPACSTTPNADSDPLRQQPGRRGRQNGSGAAEPGGDARDPDHGRRSCPSPDASEPSGDGARVGLSQRNVRDPDSARLAQREGIGGDARPELPAVERASSGHARHADGIDEVAERGALDGSISAPGGAIRRIAAAWPGWNGGVAGLGDLDDGLPRGVARAALAAYGDSVCPQITEALGRAILGIDAARRLAA